VETEENKIILNEHDLEQAIFYWLEGYCMLHQKSEFSIKFDDLFTEEVELEIDVFEWNNEY